MARYFSSTLSLRRPHLATLAALATLLLSLCCLRLPLRANTAADPYAVRIAHNQRLIADADQLKLTPIQVGNLWAALASDYHDLAQFDRAEDAYSHALRQFEPLPETKVAYIVTLGNLGSLYTITERYDAAINCHKRALAALNSLDNPLMLAREQGHLAEVYLAMGKGKEAMRYSSPAADAIMRLPLATDEDRGSILIDHAYALCLTSHCSQGLSAARQAMEIVSASFRPDSLPLAQADIALGYAEGRTGDLAPAEEHLRDGARILRTLVPPSHPLLVHALMMYKDVLTKNHHDLEAHQIAKEQQAVFEHNRTCGTCTVNVSGLRGW